MFAYLRANLLNSYKSGNKEDILISSPVDFDFEMLVVACAINLLKGLLEQRFRSTLAQDKKALEEIDEGKAEFNSRKYFSLVHKVSSKQILENNLRNCNILLRILARFKERRPFKQAYMEIVEDWES